MGAVANNTVRGVVGHTRETAESVGTVARDAVGGTLTATSDLGHQAVQAVTGVLVDVVGGVKDVLGALLPRSASSAATTGQESPTVQGTVAEPRLLPGQQTTAGPES